MPRMGTYLILSVMKLIGFLRGSGKVGSIVVKTVNGQPIASEYQPKVSNPNTSAQINQRARLKLMSQLAAALSPVIVIPRNGSQSPRNLFIKRNIRYAYASMGNAQVTYENLQITAGSTALTSIAAARANSQLTIQLSAAPGDAVTRIVYAVFKRSSESGLLLITSQVVTTPGDAGTYPVSIADISGDIIIYAYGMKDVTNQAEAQYGNLSIASGEDVARLLASRTINLTDYQFTQTRGTTLAAGDTETEVVGTNQERVFVTASGPGTVQGAGIFTLGSQVTVTATPSSGANFDGWYNNGQTTRLSTQTAYTFTLTGQTDLIAKFSYPSGSDPDNGDGME